MAWQFPTGQPHVSNDIPTTPEGANLKTFKLSKKLANITLLKLIRLESMMSTGYLAQIFLQKPSAFDRFGFGQGNYAHCSFYFSWLVTSCQILPWRKGVKVVELQATLVPLVEKHLGCGCLCSPCCTNHQGGPQASFQSFQIQHGESTSAGLVVWWSFGQFLLCNHINDVVCTSKWII